MAVAAGRPSLEARGRQGSTETEALVAILRLRSREPEKHRVPVPLLELAATRDRVDVTQIAIPCHRYHFHVVARGFEHLHRLVEPRRVPALIKDQRLR